MIFFNQRFELDVFLRDLSIDVVYHLSESVEFHIFALDAHHIVVFDFMNFVQVVRNFVFSFVSQCVEFLTVVFHFELEFLVGKSELGQFTQLDLLGLVMSNLLFDMLVAPCFALTEVAADADDLVLGGLQIGGAN